MKLKLIKWIKTLFKGYEVKMLNFDEKSVASLDDKRLTLASVDQQKLLI